MKWLASKVLIIVWMLFSFSMVSADSVSVFSVTGVDADDYLNVRQAPDTQSPIVTLIPYDGVGIRRLDGEESVGTQTWWRIKWEGKQGWVNKRYLSSPDTTDAQPSSDAKDDSKMALHCGGNEPFWGIKITKKQLIYSPFEGDILNLPIMFNKTSENNTSLAAVFAEKAGNSVMAVLQKVEACSDGMSDIDYPYSISAVINNKNFYSGCCHVK